MFVRWFAGVGGFNPNAGFEGQEEEYAEWDDAAAPASTSNSKNPLFNEEEDGDNYDAPAWGSKGTGNARQGGGKEGGISAANIDSSSSVYYDADPTPASSADANSGGFGGQEEEYAEWDDAAAPGAGSTNINLNTSPPLPTRNASQRSLPAGVHPVQMKPRLKASVRKPSQKKKAAGTGTGTGTGTATATAKAATAAAAAVAAGEYDTPGWGSKGATGDYDTPAWGSKGTNDDANATSGLPDGFGFGDDGDEDEDEEGFGFGSASEGSDGEEEGGVYDTPEWGSKGKGSCKHSSASGNCREVAVRDSDYCKYHRCPSCSADKGQKAELCPKCTATT